MGMVFQIQRFSLYDGPGVRTVVFLKGCPLRCVWCHNPEGLCAKSQILYSPNKCIGCMDCVSVCPNGCHSAIEQGHLFDRTRCSGCGACAARCCTGALSAAGTEMTPETVMEQVLRDRSVYLESGGGLTLSGGEPFAQPEFSLDLLRLAKEAGIHTAVETSGFTTADVIRQAANDTDLFLYDYKLSDGALHKKYCGVSNEVIGENLKLLDTLGAQVILRCPIIPGINDEAAHIEAITAIAMLSCVKQIHLEPYHRLGIDKAARLGMEDIFDAAPPMKDLMEQYRHKIRAVCGKPTTINS